MKHQHKIAVKLLQLFKLRLGASIGPDVGRSVCRSVGRSVFKTELTIDLLALSSKQKMAIYLYGLSSKHRREIEAKMKLALHNWTQLNKNQSEDKVSGQINSTH